MAAYGRPLTFASSVGVAAVILILGHADGLYVPGSVDRASMAR